MNSALLITAAILGQCSGGRCPAPTRFAPSYPAPVQIAPPVVIDQPVIRVVERPAPLVRRWVREDGLRFEVIGTMTPAGKINWSPDLDFNARSYATAKAAQNERRPTARPVPLPEDAAPKEQPKPEAKKDIQNFGLAPDKMGHRPDTYTADSHEAKRFIQEAKGEAGGTGMLHVTVIGTVDDCAPVVNDLNTSPALAGVRDRLMIQDYRPNEWPVDPKLGFQVNGKPTILVQAARGPNDAKGGRVVYRAMDYAGGPERLAEEIRKADPNYNPNADPGPERPDRRGCPLGFTRDHWLLIIGAGVVVFIIFSKPKVQA